MDELRPPFDAEKLFSSRRALKKRLSSADGLLPKKIAILSGSTIGEFRNMLELFLLSYGIKPEFWEGDYGRFYEDARFKNDSLAEFAPDLIYFHTSSRNISRFPAVSDGEAEREARLGDELKRWSAAWLGARSNYGCPVIANDFEPLPYRAMGSLDAVHQNGRHRFIASLNDGLYALARENDGVAVNGLSWLASRVGLDKWASAADWYMYKYMCAVSELPELAFSVANVIKAMFGKSKKALALDLDNTLWGGIIGDDGVDNICLGVETPEGWAHWELQQYLKQLYEIGVILTVDSKNEKAAALSGFSHPFSVLKESDFSAFKANWEPKSRNLRAIAQELNIGVDSIVFVDDNPAERKQVADSVPEASVLELTLPENYLAELDRQGYFETVAVTAADLKRNAQYAENRMRAEQAADFEDYGEYLRSLKMVCTVSRFSPANLERVTQLINKTNQFNMTTRRYSAAEVEAMAESGDWLEFCVRLEDIFGDNGIVGILAAKLESGAARIDTFLMSCRVFKRGLELQMLAELAKMCVERGIERVIGEYIPTAKNVIIKDFYAENGFADIGGGFFEIPTASLIEADGQEMEVVYK